jgi:hypothetical protein
MSIASSRKKNTPDKAAAPPPPENRPGPGAAIMTLSPYLEKGLATVVALMVLFVCLAALVNIPFGIDHANIIKAFDGDEYYGVMIMKRNLQNDVIDPQPFYEHGRVYQALTFWTIKALVSLGYSLSDRLIITVFRMTSFLSFVLLLIVIYLIMRRLETGLLPSALAVLFVASLPEIDHYAQIFHPDMLQLLLIVAAFAVAAWRHTFTNAYIAAGLYGLAIATKLGTPMLFPFLLLPAALKHLGTAETPLRVPREAAFLAVRVLVALLFFVLCFLVAFPYALSSVFVDRLSLMSKVVGTGIWIGGETVVPMPANPLLWVPIIAEEFSIPGLLILLAGTAAAVSTLLRGQDRSRPPRERVRQFLADEGSRSLLTALLYGLSTFLLMVLLVRMRASRYLFPVYPFLVIICFAGIDGLLKRSGKNWAGMLVSLVLLALLSSHALATVRGLSSMANKYSAPRVAASLWIMQNYGRDVSVVTDGAVYVPPEMPNFIMDEHQVARRLPQIEHNPDIRLVVVTGGSATWAWMKKGTRLRDGQIEAHPEFGAEDANRFARFLQDVAQGRSTWKLVLEYDELLVLENTKARK